MVSCFKRIVALSILVLTLSCGKDGVAPSLSCEDSCKIFLDQTIRTGNLGGVAGADAKCMSSANYPGSGIYKALIVDSNTRVACTTPNCSTGPSEHIDWVLRPNTEYKRASDGAIIAVTDTSGIFSFNLTNSFSTIAQPFYTGLTSTWTQSNARCSDWTDDSMGQGFAGNAIAVNSTSISEMAGNCFSGFQGLVCVEQ